MSKAKKLVTHMLESDPDQVDPKNALMNVPLEMREWLFRNGFTYDPVVGWYEKDIEDELCTVSPPTLQTPDDGDTWIVDIGSELRSHTNLNAASVKGMLIKYGMARP